MKRTALIMAFICKAGFAYEQCSVITNNEQYYTCSFIKKESATKKLEVVYAYYLSEVASNYAEHQDMGAALVGRIKKSQAAWLNYMNATCDVYAFQIEEKNKRHTAAINQCVTDMTEKRVLELSEMAANM